MPQRLCISADSHVVEPPELFTPLQKRLGSRAPKIVRTEAAGDQLDLGDGTLGIPVGGFLIAGMDLASDESRAAARRGYEIARPGVYDIAERLKDQDRDGLSAEVIYPSIIFNVYQVQDTEVVHTTFQAYNDWLYAYMKPAPGRLFGLGAIQLRDLDWAIDEMHRVKELGFVGLSVRCTAPPEKPFSDPFYEPFWTAAEEAGMPLAMHIFSSATPNHGLPNVPGANSPLAYMGMEVTIINLIVSGVCERHGGKIGGATLPRKPSDYWHQNFIATFEDDPIGIRTIDFIGAENLMWGSDYPHGDSIFPESQPILDGLFTGDLAKDRFTVTARNVVKLYGLPFQVDGDDAPAAVAAGGR